MVHAVEGLHVGASLWSLAAQRFDAEYYMQPTILGKAVSKSKTASTKRLNLDCHTREMLAMKLQMLANQFAAAMDVDDEIIIENLEALSHIPVDFDLLVHSRIAHSTKPLKEHPSHTVRAMVRKLHKSWKCALPKQVNAHDELLNFKMQHYAMKLKSESRRGSTASTVASLGFDDHLKSRRGSNASSGNTSSGTQSRRGSTASSFDEFENIDTGSQVLVQ